MVRIPVEEEDYGWVMVHQGEETWCGFYDDDAMECELHEEARTRAECAALGCRHRDMAIVYTTDDIASASGYFILPFDQLSAIPRPKRGSRPKLVKGGH